MSDNKFVKTVIDASTITGLAAGIDLIAKKTVKETFMADPSSNVMSYMKFTASIAIMAGGAVLNAVAFIGGNYLGRFLSGDDPSAAQEEKVWHDKALEAYQAAYAKYQKDRTKLLDWIATNDRIKAQAKQNFTNTDYAFKLYNRAHQHEQISMPKEPEFSDFHQPSEQQKQGELLFIGTGALLLHDTLGRGRGRKTYKYPLTIVDFASHFKKAEPLT